MGSVKILPRFLRRRIKVEIQYNKYEKARIIGARALQLSMGAPPLVKPKKYSQPIDLAEEELEKGSIPITILED